MEEGAGSGGVKGSNPLSSTDVEFHIIRPLSSENTLVGRSCFSVPCGSLNVEGEAIMIITERCGSQGVKSALTCSCTPRHAVSCTASPCIKISLTSPSRVREASAVTAPACWSRRCHRAMGRTGVVQRPANERSRHESEPLACPHRPSGTGMLAGRLRRRLLSQIARGGPSAFRID